MNNNMSTVTTEHGENSTIEEEETSPITTVQDEQRSTGGKITSPITTLEELRTSPVTAVHNNQTKKILKLKPPTNKEKPIKIRSVKRKRNTDNDDQSTQKINKIFLSVDKTGLSTEPTCKRTDVKRSRFCNANLKSEESNNTRISDVQPDLAKKMSLSK